MIDSTNVYDKEDTMQIIPYQVLIYDYRQNNILEWDVKKDDDSC